MHRGWKENTAETHSNIFKSDYSATLIDELVTDPAENRKIQNEIMSIIPMFIDIFHYLQSVSKHYPLIDAMAVKHNLIDRLEIKNVSFHVLHSLYNITVETII